MAAALACGLTALMISRGSRLFFNSMDGLRELDDKAQRTISLAAGFAGGTVFGLTGFMWSQAVIVEVYTLSTFTFAGVLALLMRWYFIPDRHWSLYAAYLVFGLCLANHQTLLLAAVGIELLIFMRHREIGRDLFICNSLIYLAGLLYFSSQESGSTTSGVATNSSRSRHGPRIQRDARRGAAPVDCTGVVSVAIDALSVSREFRPGSISDVAPV